MHDNTNPIVEYLTALLWNHGHLFAHIIQGKEKAGAKFSSYFNYTKPAHLVSPAHALDLIRGRKSGYLRISFKLPEDSATAFPKEINQLAALLRPEKNQIDKELFSRLRQIAEKEAVALCVQNLREHLMTSPAGKKVVMSLDTYLRGGVKIAIIDGEGKLIDTTILHLYPPLKNWYGSLAELAKLVIKHHVELISIGVGAAFRESVRLINELIKMYPDLKLFKRIIYTPSTPTYAASELIDESFWAAVSIGRQLQNPLMELSKIDPITLNVGPYKEDARPEVLKAALENLIKDCVEQVNNSSQDPRKPVQRNGSHGSLHSAQKNSNRNKQQSSTQNMFNSAMADAFAKLKTGEK
jgi:uncharacterized protein